jgi:NADH:quinone reductase (non-electrogenic)
MKLSGRLAFLAWAGIHLGFLAQASLRLTVLVQWMWTYLSNQPGSRLIIEHRQVRSGLAMAVPERRADVSTR